MNEVPDFREWTMHRLTFLLREYETRLRDQGFGRPSPAETRLYEKWVAAMTQELDRRKLKSNTMKITIVDPEKYPVEILADQDNEARVLFDIGYSGAMLAQARHALAQASTDQGIDPEDAAFLVRKIDDFMEHRLGVVPEIYKAVRNLHNNGVI